MRRPVSALLLALALGACAAVPVDLLGPDGEPLSLRPAPEQTLLLHFWATWCPSCAEDLASLQAAAATCAASRLRVYAVNVGEDAGTVEGFLRQHGVALPVLRDPEGRVWREVDGRGLPTNLFWSGDRRSVEVGPKSAAQWRRRLDSLGCPGMGSPGTSVPPPLVR